MSTEANYLGHEYIAAEKKAIELLFKGMSASEVADKIGELFIYNNEEVKEIISRAKKAISKFANYDIKGTIRSHIVLYEKIYNKLAEIGDVSGATEALRAKEDLLNLFDEESHIDKVMAVQMQDLNSKQYDVKKLDHDQRERFAILLKKMQTNE